MIKTKTIFLSAISLAHHSFTLLPGMWSDSYGYHWHEMNPHPLGASPSPLPLSHGWRWHDTIGFNTRYQMVTPLLNCTCMTWSGVPHSGNSRKLCRIFYRQCHFN